MKKMTSAEVREAFLDFFEEMGHKRVASSSLVPGNDPTLLFTNAGMVQFKDVFLGLDKRDYPRATTSQKCMRVSGKHNDLENVGPSPRHHTFFEMLGNFSFGDYFKHDAIRFAYDLLTRVYGVPVEDLLFTVHTSDDEAYAIWTEEIGVPAEKVYRMGDKTNFWQMADVGPCGPTSEIHYDWGAEACTCGIGAEPHFELDNGCARYLEIWNLVFMQFQQFPDGHREPLPKPGVDTGMGLERIVSVVQQKLANYDTDLFMPIIRRVQQLTGDTDAQRDANFVPYRVIADHMRAATFMIADGVRPGATGRDYVCRMIIRRAVRFGTKLGFEQPFLAKVADAVIETMGEAYPEIVERQEAIERTITNEEIRFRRAMDRALNMLDEDLEELKASLKQIEEAPSSVTAPVSQIIETKLAPTLRQYQKQQGTIKPLMPELAQLQQNLNVVSQAMLEALQPLQADRLKPLFQSIQLQTADMLKALTLPTDLVGISDEIRDIGQAVTQSSDAFTKQLAKLTQATIGQSDLFSKQLSELAKEVAKQSNVLGQITDIANSLLSEEQRLFSDIIKGAEIPGNEAFRLHAEKGLPLEITRDIAQEQGFSVDEEGFRTAQAHHEAVSRGVGGGAFSTIDMGEAYSAALAALREQGLIENRVKQDQYGPLSLETRLIGILRDGELVESASVGDHVELVLDVTPFYVEAGGQVSDTGVIEGQGWTVDVEDVRHPVGGLIVHNGEVVEGRPQAGETCTATVDVERRLDITRNHTATHLLHAVLRSVLGTHVQQRGSLVAPDRLRFDFSHDQPISDEELDTIQRLINEAILANYPVSAEWKDLDTARGEGAMALFGEKYGDRVRTINIFTDPKARERFSYELCGGNHVTETGVIGPFVITAEGSVAQGIRRIEALTGHGAEAYIRRSIGLLRDAAGQLGATPEAVPDRVHALQTDLKESQQEIARLHRRLAKVEFDGLFQQATEIGGAAVLVARVNPTTADTLREMTDWFRDRAQSGVIVLGTIADTGKPQLIAAATKDLGKRVHAGNIIREAAKVVGGGGGGRPDLAQAGGRDPEKLDEALHHAWTLVEQALA